MFYAVALRAYLRLLAALYRHHPLSPSPPAPQEVVAAFSEVLAAEEVFEAALLRLRELIIPPAEGSEQELLVLDGEAPLGPTSYCF